jgi:hypothetical protein
VKSRTGAQLVTVTTRSASAWRIICATTYALLCPAPYVLKLRTTIALPQSRSPASFVAA